MKRPFPVTAILVLIAALWSLGLVVSAFLVDVPVRVGAHNLVRTASGAYTEAAVVPQTYVQKYGIAELLLVGFGLALAIAVAIALRHRAAHGSAGAGRVAWGLSVAGLTLGIVAFVTIAPYTLIVGVLLVLACATFSRNGVTAQRGRSGSVPVTTSTPH